MVVAPVLVMAVPASTAKTLADPRDTGVAAAEECGTKNAPNAIIRIRVETSPIL